MSSRQLESVEISESAASGYLLMHPDRLYVELTMDKKTQKRIAILRERIQRLQRMLAGVKVQSDEPDEVERAATELRKTRSELDSLLNP